MRKHQAALCVAESDELQTPDVITAPFCCYRLRKSDYGAEDLQQIEKQLADKAAKGDVFAYIKHEDTPKGSVAGGFTVGQVAKTSEGYERRSR